ncbi:sortase [Clostridium beijerinckii]|nr:sortase [Clostridium beijerinckii]
MMIYHGSNVEIDQPKIIQSNRALDFGFGFYTTTFKEQAEKWALRKCTNFKGEIEGKPTVSIYELDLEFAKSNYKVHEYKGVTNEWLEFILMNRKDINSKSPYDITIGEVADDQVFATINLLSRGWIDVNVATQRLKFKLPNNQVCINNQEVIEKCLKYVGMEVVK